MSLQELYDHFLAWLPKLVAALPIVLCIIIGAILLNLVIGRVLLLLAGRTHLTAADLAPVRQVIRWILRLLALILILGVFGFELGGLWAMISTVLGLVAIGFVAVWSLLSNASSTVLILFLRPYAIGDDIEFPGEAVKGRVVDLNFFFTTLIDHEGNLLQIPNNLFFQKTVKRRIGQPNTSLALQLNSPTAAKVQLPPAPEPAKVSAPATADPLMSIPDPRTIAPPGRK